MHGLCCFSLCAQSAHWNEWPPIQLYTVGLRCRLPPPIYLIRQSEGGFLDPKSDHPRLSMSIHWLVEANEAIVDQSDIYPTMGISLGILQQVPNFKRRFEKKCGKTEEMLSHCSYRRCTPADRLILKWSLCLCWFTEDDSYFMKEWWVLLLYNYLLFPSPSLPAWAFPLLWKFPKASALNRLSKYTWPAIF